MLILHYILSIHLFSFYRHNDSKTSGKDATYHFVAVVQSQELFPLQIRLSFSPETNSLLVKISLKVISLLQSFILSIIIFMDFLLLNCGFWFVNQCCMNLVALVLLSFFLGGGG